MKKVLGLSLIAALAVMMPAYADAGDSMDANGVVTRTNTPYGVAVTGYYDQNCSFHYGWKPYLLGYYDGHGDWHDYPNTEVWTTGAPGHFPDAWRYEFNKSNFYAGYGARWEWQRGYTRVIGEDGQPHWVDLKPNRTIVRLSHNNDPWRTIIVNQFEDPAVIWIPAGTTVTYVTSDGSYALSPESGPQFTEKVTINPGLVYNWTYTQPGTYNVKNASGGGPTDCHYGGLVIHVTGNTVAFDESAFVDASSYTWRRLPWRFTQSTFTPYTLPNQPPAYTPAPPPPPPRKHVHKKKVPRNIDIK